VKAAHPYAPLADVGAIAVLRPNAVGDFIYALPCLHALRMTYPHARIVYIGKQWHADFLADRPGPVDEVQVLPPCPGVGLPPDAGVNRAALEDFVEAMRAARFDLALQIYGGGLFSNPFIKRFGARLTVGMKAADAGPLDRWVHYGPLQNRRLQLLEVAALAGAQAVPPVRELAVSERDRREAEQVLPHELQHDLPRNSAPPLVLIQPGASDPRRRWDAAHFAAVADRLAAQGARIAVNGTAAEGPVVRAVLERMHAPALDLTGRLSLSGLCGLLERSALLVSNDTGPLHLALALGTPSVGIYWLTNLIEAAPLRQHGHRPLLAVRLHCPVCGQDNLRRRCAHDPSFVDDVGVEDVTAAALELLAERG
jgi:ADP-heptose:LPS heptosyltransferase